MRPIIGQMKKVGRWIVGALIGAMLLLMAYAGQQVYAYANVTSDADADAAIVLGAAVWEGEPSPVFAERLNHAIDLYQQERVRVLIFTGGKGEGDQLAESEVARRYALEHGVAEADIYCEAASHITSGNLRGARAIMAREGVADALLVSDPLHMRRAMRIAEDLGLTVYPSPTPTTRYRTWRTKLGFLLRESRLYASYLLRRPWLQHQTRDRYYHRVFATAPRRWLKPSADIQSALKCTGGAFFSSFATRF